MDQTLLRELTTAPSPLPVALQQIVYTKATSAGDARLLAALAARTDLAASLVDKLALDKHATVTAAWAGVPGRVAASPERFLNETRPSVLAAVAAQPGLPASLYEVCASSPSLKVAAALALNPDTPSGMRQGAAVRLAGTTRYRRVLGQATVPHPELASVIIKHTGSLDTATYVAAIPGVKLSPSATSRLVGLFTERFTIQATQVGNALRDRVGLKVAADAWYGTMTMAAALTRVGSLPLYAARILEVHIEETLPAHGLAAGGPHTPDLLHMAIQSVRAWHTPQTLVHIRQCSDSAALAELLDSAGVKHAWKEMYVRDELTVAVARTSVCTPQLIVDLIASDLAVALKGRSRDWLRYAVSAHATAGRTETALAAAALADISDNPAATADRFAEAAGVDVATLQHFAVKLCATAGRADLAGMWATAGPRLPDDVIATLPAASAAAAVGPERLTEYLIDRFGGDPTQWDVLLALAAHASHTTVGDLANAAAGFSKLDTAARICREGAS